MNRAALAAVGVALGVAGWLAFRRGTGNSEPGGVGFEIENAISDGVDFMNQATDQLSEAFGFIRVSNMSKVEPGLVNHPNVRAMLRVIRQGESSQNDSIAYRMIVGGKHWITSFNDHPRIFGVPHSTAAGAYQITKTTWDETKRLMGLKDFSPASQDLAAVGRMAYRGALPSVLAGDVETAIKKLRNEWTSLPGAKENNKAAGDLANAKRLFVSWGGQLGGPVYA